MKWTISLEEKLSKIRGKEISTQQFQDYIQSIFEEQQNRLNQIKENIQSKSKHITDFKFDLLDTSKIYHKSQIKKLCIQYRLRFLGSELFKNEIPQSTLHKIKKLENEHQTKIKSFKIVAPSKMFKLENYDDPLLFTPIGNNYYYLIDKWGNDLSIFRKIAVYPFRNLEVFALFLVLVSAILAFLIPENTFGRQNPTVLRSVMFLFILKAVIGIAIYFIFWKGKNFNAAIWKSRFSNHK